MSGKPVHRPRRRVTSKPNYIGSAMAIALFLLALASLCLSFVGVLDDINLISTISGAIAILAAIALGFVALKYDADADVLSDEIERLAGELSTAKDEIKDQEKQAEFEQALEDFRRLKPEPRRGFLSRVRGVFARGDQGAGTRQAQQ